MSYDENDAALDEFYDRISDELFPEHKEIAISQFIEERVQSYFILNPNIIEAPMECSNHANELLSISSRCSLVMYATSIELYLKSVLLKPVLFGMVHDENIAELIVNATINQSGFQRYNKLLSALCLHAAEIELSSIKGMNNDSIIKEAEKIQSTRNRVIHRGENVTLTELGNAKATAYLMLTDVVEPVLNNLDLAIVSSEEGSQIIKCS